jgi:hypothetical protein
LLTATKQIVKVATVARISPMLLLPKSKRCLKMRRRVFR